MVARNSGLRTRLVKVGNVFVPLQYYVDYEPPTLFRIVLYAVSIIIITVVMMLVWIMLP
jgi:hypothetical protein